MKKIKKSNSRTFGHLCYSRGDKSHRNSQQQEQHFLFFLHLNLTMNIKSHAAYLLWLLFVMDCSLPTVTATISLTAKVSDNWVHLISVCMGHVKRP